MQLTSLLSAAALTATTLASSPRGFSPYAAETLAVTYDEVFIFDGIKLPQSIPDDYTPTVWGVADPNKTYMILLTDLQIPDADFFTAAEIPTLVQGLGANRTTRLHWWQNNATHDTLVGEFSYPDTAFAPYAGPEPPANDTFHDYVFWLFHQPADYAGPALADVEIWQNGSTDGRFNFSLPALAQEVGLPIAATYFRTQDSANSDAPTEPTFDGGPYYP